MISIWTASFLFTLAAFTAVWAMHVKMKDAGVIDYYWGPGFAISGWLMLAIYGQATMTTLIYLGVVSLWATRLAAHLIARHKRSKSEDARYKAMRDAGGSSFWWKSLFTIFTLQAVIHWLVSAPVLLTVIASNQPPSASMPPLFAFGLAIFAVGFLIETIADWQIDQFKRDVPESGLFQSGLWGLSRHPNYLGEMIIWIGLGLSAYAISGSILALISPVFLIIVMAGISIPLTDQHMRASRSGYAAYEMDVPALLPRFSSASKQTRKLPADN